MNSTNEKYEVLNPILLFNTIGEEICEIFNDNACSFDTLNELLNIPAKKPSEITKLNKQQIKQIASRIQKPELYDYFLNFQNEYKASKIIADAEYKHLKKIYSKIKHISFLLDKDFNGGIDKLEDIANFLEIEDEKKIFQFIDKNIALYKISNFKPDNFNLYSWLKKGERDFKKANLSLYHKNKLLQWLDNKEWKTEINNPNYFLNLPNIFRDFGVALIYTPYLTKTVYGCVRWFDNVPVVQISDKGKDLAMAWYVLFHELGHVIKHENDEIFEGNIEELSQAKINKKEKEANAFAYDYLFDGDSLRKFIFTRRGQSINGDDFIDLCSKKYNVDPILIVFWAQKARITGINYSKYRTKIDFQIPS